MRNGVSRNWYLSNKVKPGFSECTMNKGKIRWESLLRRSRDVDGSHMEKMTTNYNISEMPKNKKSSRWAKESIFTPETSEGTVSKGRIAQESIFVLF